MNLKLFEEFKLEDIKNKTVQTAIEVIKSYGVKVVFKNPDYFAPGSIGTAAILSNTIKVSTDILKKASVEKIVSLLFHELGHFYCYDTLKYKEYHYGFYKKNITEKEIKSMVRTALKAELYVENWGKKEMKLYFPNMKYIMGYKRRGYIKRWIVNYLYDRFDDRIVELEAEKLGKMLDEMGI